jgi:hypothetical protein
MHWIKSSLFCSVIAILLVVTACTEQASDMAEEATADTQETPAPPSQPVSQALPPRASEARPSPNARVEQTVGTTVVTNNFGRPSVKGRQVFGGLEPNGAVWRAGANEATVFSVSGDVTVNGQTLPAGVYGFFAIPNEGAWTLIFNAVAEQWGAFDYEESQDVLRVTATPESGPHQESLDYYFEDLSPTSATAVLHWDTVRVPFVIAVE